MKYILILLLSTTASFCFAQVDIEIEPNSIDTSFINTDLTDVSLDLPLTVYFHNNEPTQKILEWIVDDSNFRDQWEFQISEVNFDFVLNTISSPEPLLLDSLARDNIFNLHFYPRSTAGCGSLKFYFNEMGSQEIIDSISYNIKVNDEACLSSSTSSINSIPEVSIFPNPTTETINVSSSIEFDEIQLIDLQGHLIKSSKENFIRLEYLHSAVYFIKIKYGSKYIVKKVVLNKS